MALTTRQPRTGSVLPLLAPAAVYGAIVLAYYRRLRSTLALPDYGDLWRMSLRYSIDGDLDFSEPFIEAEPLSHIPILHAVLNHLAITRSDYSLFWIVGVVAAIATGWLVGAGLVALIPRTDRRLVAILACAMAGVLAFRFDVRNLVTNSLLLESQTLFLQGTVAIALATRLTLVRHDRTSGVICSVGDPGRLRTLATNERALACGLLIMLVIGDAPTGVVSLCMIALGVTAGFIARPPLGATFRLLAIIGGCALGLRWLALELLDASGRPNPARDLEPLQVIVDTTKLIGAGLVNQTALYRGSQATYDRVHLIAAVALLALWAATILRLLRRSEPTRGEVGFAMCLTLGVAFIVLSSAATAAVRGVNGAHQVSRATRNTALAAPAGLAALYYNLRLNPRAAGRAATVTFGCALSLLALRSVAVGNGYANVGDVVRFREVSATIVCEQPPTEERWDRLWHGFQPVTIEKVLASDHLQLSYRAGCVSPSD